MTRTVPANLRPSLPPHELDALCQRVRHFIDEEAIPREDMSKAHDIGWLDDVTRVLRAKAQAQGLIAPQLPKDAGGMGLNWQDCARVFEVCGRSFLGAGPWAVPRPINPISIRSCTWPPRRKRRNGWGHSWRARSVRPLQ